MGICLPSQKGERLGPQKGNSKQLEMGKKKGSTKASVKKANRTINGEDMIPKEILEDEEGQYIGGNSSQLADLIDEKGGTNTSKEASARYKFSDFKIHRVAEA